MALYKFRIIIIIITTLDELESWNGWAEVW